MRRFAMLRAIDPQAAVQLGGFVVFHSLKKSRSTSKRPMQAGAAHLEFLERRQLLSAIPAPLTGVEIGTPTGGSASFDTNTHTFTIVGSGFDVFGAHDAFYYVSEPLVGDGTVTVQVTSDSANAGKSLAGLVIRDSLATDAANVWVATRDDGSLFVDTRPVDGGIGINKVQGVAGSFPEFLRLKRTGSTVVASFSSDGGNTYTILSTDTVSFSTNTLFVGMAASSQDAPGTLATATFSNFSVVPAGPTATLTSAPTVSAGLSTPYQFTVTYNSASIVNAASVGNNNWLVQIPGGGTEAATLVSTGLTNGTTVVATYQIPAPAVSGTYSIITGSGPVSDLSTSSFPGATLGSFSVTSSAPTSNTITGLVRSSQLVGVAGATVFIDANHNGVFDAGESSFTTSASGVYSLTGLADGTYTVAESAPLGQQVLPHTSDIVTVSGDQTLSDINFVNTSSDTATSTTDVSGKFRNHFIPIRHVGSTHEAIVRVVNSGASKVTGFVQITLLLTTDGTASTALGVLKTQRVKLNLKSGKHHGYGIFYTYPKTSTVGNRKIVAVLDSGDSLAESNETNNLFSSTPINLKAAVAG